MILKISKILDIVGEKGPLSKMQSLRKYGPYLAGLIARHATLLFKILKKYSTVKNDLKLPCFQR